MRLTCVADESGNTYTFSHGIREIKLPKGYRINIGEQSDSLTVEQWQEPWNGEGLPPVGTVCELRKKDGGWGQATINYMSTTTCVWLWDNGNPDQREWACEPWNMEFRKIRTPEQIAAEEHANAIRELIERTDYILDETAAEAVLAAGYRKPE